MAKSIKINGVNFTEVTGAKAKSLRMKYTFMHLAYRIWCIYDRPSQAKIEIWRECERIRLEMSGCDSRACSNTFTFSYAFECKVEGVQKLVYITKDNNYICDLY